MNNYEIVIGLEVHSQLLTKSKMFCACAAAYQDNDPNTLVCEVCMGMPGVLPVINKKAVELVIATGLALDCTISKHTQFDRKNYPYPDLMKGYQISQYTWPIAESGHLQINENGESRTIGITQVHLEEDTAKLIHKNQGRQNSYSLLDINRAGVPLMEIVSEPDIRSADEARLYLTSLHSILQYINVSTANMEEGSFRCDANISVRPVGSSNLGVKVEVKNMNSFRAVHRALEFEAHRQTNMIDQGQRIVQETRGWVEGPGITVSQRTKEYASDYRYFPEPDLPPIKIDTTWVNDIKSRIPELPSSRKSRYTQEYGLSEYDAEILTTTKSTAEFFESVMSTKRLQKKKAQHVAKTVSNWITGELARLVKSTGEDMDAIRIQPHHMITLIDLVDSGELNMRLARQVFEEMFNTGLAPEKIVEKVGVTQINDSDWIETAITDVIANNPDPVNDYIRGKESAIKYIIGQVMKNTEGQVNPKILSELLIQRLETLR